MIRAIDHIVILVNDLQAAIDDYAALGFSVAPGGTHADGATHNALIIFADDTYNATQTQNLSSGATEMTISPDGDEVAFFPPVTGG